MKTVNLRIKDKEYELKIPIRNLLRLEKALGHNPLDGFMKLQENSLPTMNEVLTILFYAMPKDKFQKVEDMYDLYEAYVEDGKSYIDLIPILIEVFQESGIMSKSTDEEVEEKN